MNALRTWSGTSARGIQRRRWFSSNISANCSPFISSTMLSPGSLRPFSLLWSGRTEAALLYRSITSPRSTTGCLNRLVLAKLPVCRLQIGKIDATELVVLAAKRTRIVHCGVNEVIEVYILDLEGLDHVGAAGLEQFRHLLLISIATEFCLHCLRGCRHLAKRQSRSKNFDEKPFHPGAPFKLPQSLSRLVGAPWFGERWG